MEMGDRIGTASTQRAHSSAVYIHRCARRSLMRITLTKKNESAFATLIVIMLISLMLAFVTANLNALFNLKREVKLLEQRHQKRWAQINSATNSGTDIPNAPRDLLK